MSFPLSPTNGQTAVVNGITYQYSSTTTAWSRVPQTYSRTTTSATAPVSPTPVAGDQWYNPTTDTLYRYTFDGVASYWVDISGSTTTTTVGQAQTYLGETTAYGNITPTTNALYNIGSTSRTFANIYVANGVFYANGASTSPSYTTSATAPTNPVIGSQWYNTSTDIIYEYVNDGVGTYWVDISSDIGSNATSGNIAISSSLIPTTNAAYDLGSNSRYFGNLYVSNSTIGGNANITAATASTSTTTGALTVAGGAGVAGNVYVGGNAVITGYISAPNTFGFKNRIINGAMSIWQRGTSFTFGSGTNTYTADRWWGVCNTASGETVSQVTDVPTSQAQYSLKMQRPNGNTGTAALNIIQIIETANCYDLAGQNVTLSFWAKTGANYSGGALSVYVQSGTVADQGNSSYFSWTGRAFPVASTTSLTTTWTKYTFTGTVASGVLELGVQFAFTPTGTAGADDSVYITGVQLEPGPLSTPFDYRPYGTELDLCQRYFEMSYDIGTAPGTATNAGATVTALNGTATTGYIGGQVFHKATKRATPSITFYDALGASGKCQRSTPGVGSNNGQNVNPDNVGLSGFNIVASSGTSNQCVYAQWTSSSEL